MSSPPFSSTPPQLPNQAPLPSKKRPSLNTDMSQAKRRKHSQAGSTSTLGLHPLRQTSFPHEIEGPAAFAVAPQARPVRSPSVDSSVAGASVITARGKRAKADGRSVTGSSVRGGRGRATAANSVVSGKTGRGGKGGEGTAREDEEEEEEDEGDLDAAALDGEKADEQQERQKLRWVDHLCQFVWVGTWSVSLLMTSLRILVEAFTADQSDRYDTFRRIKLNPPTVRRVRCAELDSLCCTQVLTSQLANQTLSQSVPEAVVKTINGFTKVFIGEVIEKARDVQAQWLAAEFPDQVISDAERGPLLPDHFREALRRYRKDMEGGGAGFHALSLGNMAGYPVATGGKRLFR